MSKKPWMISRFLMWIVGDTFTVIGKSEIEVNVEEKSVFKFDIYNFKESVWQLRKTHTEVRIAKGSPVQAWENRRKLRRAS